MSFQILRIKVFFLTKIQNLLIITFDKIKYNMIYKKIITPNQPPTNTINKQTTNLPNRHTLVFFTK